MWWLAPLLGSSLLGSFPDLEVAHATGSQWIFIGTYTNGGKSQGIYRLEIDNETGRVSEPTLAAESPDPSFLAVHPTKRFLFAVNELATFEGKPSGSVTGFTLDAKTGVLGSINKQSSRGAAPCHLSIDHTGKAVLVANYSGGSVAALPIGDDGRLGPATAFAQHEGSSADKSRQSEPHAHSINLDAGNRFAVAADLGLDKLLVYKFDPLKPALVPDDPPFAKVAPGSGPRHFAFHPDGKHAYVINELKSTVTAFDYNAERGVLSEIQTIGTLPVGFTGSSSTAEVQVHPSGKFLYGSNRGHDSIAVFAIEPGTGRLKALEQVPTGGKNPRNFGIDATGKFLLAANQDSDTIKVFKIDGETGRLTPTGQIVAVPVPVCVKFVPKAE
jgi:6-phosphogluconolactonase